MGKLFFGDNLDILREYFQSETVDLIYLDPPFNSKKGYNVLFKTPTFDPKTADRGSKDTDRSENFNSRNQPAKPPGRRQDALQHAEQPDSGGF